MGFVRRISSRAKVPMPDKARKEIEFFFMNKIVKKIENYDIPHHQVISVSQTLLKYVPVDCST